MRKRLLRSRSGFEKPESREEAIMQNILGASNVLEPSESNIEEILKSILYNTPYTKEAEFEIEKILLAIKNNGTYDGEGESRDMKILIAILNDLDYTEEAESRIEELFIEWLQQRQQIKVLEGVPPLTFPARGLPLINYLIEGNAVQNGTPTPDNPIMPQGTGERTGNLYNVPDESATTNGLVTLVDLGADTTVNAITVSCMFDNLLATGSYSAFLDFLKDDGTHQYVTLSNIYNVADDTPVIANTITTGNYYVTKNNITFRYIKAYLYSTAYNKFQSGTIKWAFYDSEKKDYEPYGYKIPISSAGQTTNINLGEVETTRKIKKLVLTGLENWGTYTLQDSSYCAFLSVDNFLGATTSSIAAPIMCSHYEVRPQNNIYNRSSKLAVGGRTNQGLLFVDIDITSETEWKNYLAQQYAAGTPVTIWYVLAAEQTGIVNEPLMKIGSYADSISMEQTGIEIPTINGSNTFDVNTTVKPSNVYIEYK